MAGSPRHDPEDGQQSKRPRRGLLPPELVEALTPALKVGMLAGGAGAVSGVAAGIIRDAPPALFGLVSSVQWFTLGSTYWFSRLLITRSWEKDKPLGSGERIKASALAGGAAGMVGGLLRGPRNIVPGTIMFSIFGAVGQGAVNKLSELGRSVENADEDSSWLRSKYSPLRKLTDEEYEAFIAEKMLKVEAEIALIDDKITELKAEHAAKQTTEERFDVNTGRESLPEGPRDTHLIEPPQGSRSWWKKSS